MYVRTAAARASSLWLARRFSREKGVWHYALIDFSGWLVPGGAYGGVAELMPTGPRTRWMDGSEYGDWQFLQEVHDIAGAIRRLRNALGRPDLCTYSALRNNCESFARGIAFGRGESHQVRDGIIVAAGLTLVACFAKPKPARSQRSRRR